MEYANGQSYIQTWCSKHAPLPLLAVYMQMYITQLPICHHQIDTSNQSDVVGDNLLKHVVMSLMISW